MAHGGGPAWNTAVLSAAESVSERVPTRVAFGMADPETLEDGLNELASVGVNRVAVVRLFLSGESFRDQTRYLLGLSAHPPESWVLMGPPRATPPPIEHSMEIATHDVGLMMSSHATDIMVERALDLSEEPADEAVLFVAHGMGGEDANDRVIEAMRRAEERTSALGFAAVRSETLREDWPGPREEAERDIRAFVSERATVDRKVIVVPFRLSGFGPYARVLAGLEYTPAAALLPHPAIGEWIQERAATIVCQRDWNEDSLPCPTH